MEISEQIAAGILNGVVIAVAFVLLWAVNRFWADRLDKMNEDWEKQCQKVNEMWRDTCREMLADHKEQIGKFFDRWVETNEDMRKERSQLPPAKAGGLKEKD